MKRQFTCEKCGGVRIARVVTNRPQKYCKGCYIRSYTGSGPRTVHDRFMCYVRVDEATGCWLWTGSIGANGYGFFYGIKKVQRPHRWSYEYFKEAIPDGLVIDHLCRVKHCVNPEHLEAVTIRENTIRGIGPKMLAERHAARRAAKAQT